MVGEFTGSLAEYAKDQLKHGVIGAVGLIANDRWIGSRVLPYLKSAGRYAGPAEGFLVGLVYRYLGEKMGHADMGASAGNSLFSYKLAQAFSSGPLDPPITHGNIGRAALSSGEADWGSVGPIPLSRAMAGGA